MNCDKQFTFVWEKPSPAVDHLHDTNHTTRQTDKLSVLEKKWEMSAKLSEIYI